MTQVEAEARTSAHTQVDETHAQVDRNMGGLGGDNTEMPVGVFRLRRVTAPNVANAPSLAPSRGSSQFGHTSFPGGWHQCRKLCKLLKDSRLPNPDDQFQGHVPRCFQGRSGRPCPFKPGPFKPGDALLVAASLAEKRRYTKRSSAGLPRAARLQL